MLHDWHHRSIYLLSVCAIGWSSVFKSWDEVRTSTFIPHYTDSNIAPTYWQYFKGWIKHSHILKEKLAFLILYSYFISTAFFLMLLCGCHCFCSQQGYPHFFGLRCGSAGTFFKEQMGGVFLYICIQSDVVIPHWQAHICLAHVGLMCRLVWVKLLLVCNVHPVQLN